ncbi:phage tail protein [Vibrio kyushuensis]|uniref:phage tail-collar fiber domain-containing protein n=1 Tax=Vibrio kyushuensis TaxID=2910249 RepID=UPI003D0D52C3
MTQTAIPLEFETYMRNQIAVGQPTDMNEMIFAYIPDLDPGLPIDRNQGLPDPALWVFQQDMDQVGKLGPNALVHSVVIANDVAEFTFNAIYMHDKTTPLSCGMVVHTVDQTKLEGQAVTKSLMHQYLGAAEIANITIEVATWQIDYSARLMGMDEDHRLACLDNYGHTAYVDGYDVTRQPDPTRYLVSAGVVYIGGLRAVLADELLVSTNVYPNGIYVDVHRDGSPTSKWVNIVEIKVSPTPLTDYIDENGFQHYVARLAGLDNSGDVVDWRSFVVRASETQVQSRVVGNQNANVAGEDNHPVPSDTEYTYPAGQEIAAGWLAVTECKITKVGKELSGTGTYRRTIDGEFPDDYFGVKRLDNSQDKTGVSLAVETGNTNIDVDLLEAGPHMFPGSCEIEGIWPSVGDDESTKLYTHILAELEDTWPDGATVNYENLRKFRFITLFAKVTSGGAGLRGLSGVRVSTESLLKERSATLLTYTVQGSATDILLVAVNNVTETSLDVEVAQSGLFNGGFYGVYGEI